MNPRLLALVAIAGASALSMFLREQQLALTCADPLCLAPTHPDVRVVLGAWAHRALWVLGVGAASIHARDARWSAWTTVAATTAVGAWWVSEVTLLEPTAVFMQATFAAVAVGSAAIAARAPVQPAPGLELTLLGVAAAGVVVTTAAVHAYGAGGACLDWPGCPTRDPALGAVEWARRVSLAALVGAAALSAAVRWRHPNRAVTYAALHLSVAVLALDAAVFFTDKASELVLAQIILLHIGLVGLADAVVSAAPGWPNRVEPATSAVADPFSRPFPSPAPPAVASGHVRPRGNP